MKILTVIENKIFVRRNEYGLYNLNALHKSAMDAGLSKRWQQPNQFLLNDGIKSFVQEVSKLENSSLEQNQVLTISHGGDNNGIWAHELIALRYAAWLSPKFEVKVYKVFQSVLQDRLKDEVEENKVKMQYQIGKMSASEAGKRLHRGGLGGEKRQLEQKLDVLSLKLEYVKV